ncbi:hypothetical protein JCM15754A_11700 [Prevotella aurantiaca JCM 15754]
MVARFESANATEKPAIRKQSAQKKTFKKLGVGIKSCKGSFIIRNISFLQLF